MNKILILGRSDDLEFSASSTVRPLFKWPLDRPFWPQQPQIWHVT